MTDDQKKKIVSLAIKRLTDILSEMDSEKKLRHEKRCDELDRSFCKIIQALSTYQYSLPIYSAFNSSCSDDECQCKLNV